jgi:RNA-directed DNA polymerase
MPEIWYEAYANIYSNKGAITKGVNQDTLDGFSNERVEKIITALREEKYRFTPVRRTYIPKRAGNKKRPLGVPGGDDKLVQEVVRILLERIYEPIFTRNSHGFRPGRSCHTALEQIQKEWTGIKCFIEFDIRDFYGSMSHEIMVKLLEKKIDDRRFIKLIKSMLRSGYLEDWIYHPTYSGTPQGGVSSAIMSNIYLHELDTFMENLSKETTKGKERRRSRDYMQVSAQKTRIRRSIDKMGKTPGLIKALKETDRIQKTLPSRDPFDEGYRRLRYCRYADDLLFGYIGSRDEAIEIMKAVETFLERELRLQVAKEKTGISTGREGVNFLGYSIRVNGSTRVVRIKRKGTYTRQRTTTHAIRLEVPEGKAQEFCQRYGYGDWQRMKPLHRPQLTGSDTEIVYTYNAELRGLGNYYALADDVKTKLRKLEYLANYSLFKTLARKHKISMVKAIARLKKGNDHVHRYRVKDEVREVKVFKLRHMEKKPKVWEVDEIPNTLYLSSPRSELVKRLNGEECEYCGQTDPPLRSHHIRRLRDLRKKTHLKVWEKVMIARNRKTLVLCEECHELLHKGKLPDNRYRDKSLTGELCTLNGVRTVRGEGNGTP